MTRRTVRALAELLIELGMVTEEKAAAVLAEIAKWRAEHLDEELDEKNVIGWIPEFGIAISIHSEDVDDVADYYRSKLEDDVVDCTGGAVVVSDVALVRIENDYEYLHFRRNGESMWWYVDHESDDYVDLASVSEQFNDLDPGGNDPRMFHQIRRRDSRFGDDVYLLASPEQAAALGNAFGLDFYGVPDEPPSDGNLIVAEPDSLEWYMAMDRRVMTEPAKIFLDRWLSDMVPALVDWRIRFLPSDFPFDFGIDSLHTLETLVFDRFPSWSGSKSTVVDPFVTGAVRYLGETLIRNAPCHWAYQDIGDTSSDYSMYNRVPMIRSNTPRAFQHTMVPLISLSCIAHREFGILAETVQEIRAATLRYESARRTLS
ncbi:hypothetical protein [Nocardia arthritidis]|uniref:Uncharacterized protein n=1 Tax=Nocardia arthritidis TaxID=228602 RepID=A0A6G9Y465_9NOCA|nr:hypothetical protein [Nocardia arthritidis]QIS08008.1 hypothetical protein F5544_00375 [Nocardia arthritidis]